MVYAEAGVQTDTLTNKNIVVLKQPEKRVYKRPLKRSIKNISNATPDIQQQWRMWKGIDERNMLRNVVLEEDIYDKLRNVFGDNMSEIEKVRDTFDRSKGKAITVSPYSIEQQDNRVVARRIGGTGSSAVQGGLQRVAGNDWNGLGIEDLLQSYSVAPRFSMSEIEASQGGRSRVGSRELSSLGGLVQGIGIGGYNMRTTARRALNRFVEEARVGALGERRAESSISGATTMRPSIVQPEVLGGRAPRFGISEGMRSGSRRTEGYV